MYLPLVLLGVTGMTAQAVFLREMLASFTGGEFAIGAILFFWLLWTAVGSGLGGALIGRIGDSGNVFRKLMPWYGVLGLAGVVTVSAMQFLIGTIVGEMLSFDIALLAAALVMAPFNIFGGFLFTLGVQAYKRSGKTAAGKAYTTEAAGAAAGGAAVALVLAPLFPNIVIATLCPVIGIAAGIIGNKLSFTFHSALAMIAPALAVIALLLFHRTAATYPYRGQILLEETDTKFGRLKVTKREEQVTFYSDAAILFSSPDAESSEHTAHIPLLAADDPHRVLVLGGSASGVIDEILKYPSIEAIVCVELDPVLLDLVEKYSGARWFNNPKVSRVVTDGRSFIENTDATFDVIIMTMPSPLSGQTNRYYTEEFFRAAASRLNDDGILSFSLDGAENYLSNDLAAFLAGIRATLRTVFPSTVVLPGVSARFLGSKTPGAMEKLTGNILEERRNERGIQTTFVRDYYLTFTMSDFRIEALKEQLDNVSSPQINTDFRPTGYFLRTAHQGTVDRSPIIGMITRAATPRTLRAILATALALIVLFAIIPGGRIAGRTVTASVVSTGMTELSLEILAIMTYQSLYGYLYGRITLLTGIYMAGLALGGWFGVSRISKGMSEMKTLAAIQTVMVVLVFAWGAFLAIHMRVQTDRPVFEMIFFLLTGLAGFIGGYQFPIADAVSRGKILHNARLTGRLYAADLAGSSLGALAMATLVLPVLGVNQLLAYLAAANTIIVIVIIRNIRRNKDGE